MLNDFSRAQLAGAWCAAVAVLGACGVVAGAALTIGSLELLLAVCFVPPVVMLLLWRGAPAVTVAEVLYAVNSPSKEGRP
jgi:hypothetical protein